MKILVIHTGGTISCNENDGVLSANSSSDIVKLCRNSYGNDIIFKEEFFSSVLSENSDDSFLAGLVNYLNFYDIKGIDAVIVLHGTDTLSYTASFVAMCLRHFTTPVAFVSANFVLTNENSNGIDNFNLAVAYFKDGGKGFAVPYKNADSRRIIHLATRLQEADSVTGSFSSFAFKPLAEAVSNYLVSYGGDHLPTNDELSIPQERIITDNVELKNKILLIKAYPGIDYSYFDFKESKPAAILHTAFHSGTANSDLLPSFIEKCRNDGIDFYLSPVGKSAAVYSSTKLILESGAVPIYNMNTESALAKLKIKYNIKNIDVNEDLYYETV